MPTQSKYKVTQVVLSFTTTVIHCVVCIYDTNQAVDALNSSKVALLTYLTARLLHCID